jgi:hypothetical protein
MILLRNLFCFANRYLFESYCSNIVTVDVQGHWEEDDQPLRRPGQDQQSGLTQLILHGLCYTVSFEFCFHCFSLFRRGYYSTSEVHRFSSLDFSWYKFSAYQNDLLDLQCVLMEILNSACIQNCHNLHIPIPVCTYVKYVST